MKLQDKVVLVTGADRGIGKATALACASEGAKIVVHFRTGQAAAQEVVQKIVDSGGEAMAIHADLAQLSNVEFLFEQVKQKFGTLDVLVNNAGIMKPQGPFQLIWEDVLETFVVDTISPMFCAREAMKIMVDQNKPGSIINITSVRGLEHVGLGGNLAYSAAKAALNNFTCSLAKEWDIKKHKIRVNAIAPGYTDTDLHTWDADTKAKKAQETVLNKILDPQDIAHAVAFLASDDASGVTGEILVVDAGLRLK